MFYIHTSEYLRRVQWSVGPWGANFFQILMIGSQDSAHHRQQ